MGPQTSEPDTMNLQRVAQKAGLQCVDNDHHGVPHGPRLSKEIGPRHDPRSFSQPPLYVGRGGPLFYFSLSPFYNRFISPEWGPQSGYLSHQLLPSVVESGCKIREVWLCQAQGTERNSGNLFLRRFRFLYYLFCFSTFPAL